MLRQLFEGDFHEVDPDRLRGATAKFGTAKATLVVVKTDPGSSNDVRGVAGEPGIPRFVGGTGFAGDVVTFQVAGCTPAGTTPAVATPDGCAQGVGDQERTLGTDGMRCDGWRERGLRAILFGSINCCLRQCALLGRSLLFAGGASNSRIGLIEGVLKTVGHFVDEVWGHQEATVGQYRVTTHYLEGGEFGSTQRQRLMGRDEVAGEAKAGQTVDIGIQTDGAHQSNRHHVLGLGQTQTQRGGAIINGRGVLGLPHGPF